MAKFSINIPDEYDSLLAEWAESLGDKRGSLAGHLVKLCIEKRYPDRLPSVPNDLPGDTPYELPSDVQLSKWVAMAINLGGAVSTPEAFAATSMRGHFSRWLKSYRQRILDFADEYKLSFPQAYALLTSKQPPYSGTDLEWARDQPELMTEARFLGHLPEPETAPSLTPENDQ